MASAAKAPAQAAATQPLMPSLSRCCLPAMDGGGLHLQAAGGARRRLAARLPHKECRNTDGLVRASWGQATWCMAEARSALAGRTQQARTPPPAGRHIRQACAQPATLQFTEGSTAAPHLLHQEGHGEALVQHTQLALQGGREGVTGASMQGWQVSRASPSCHLAHRPASCVAHVQPQARS